MHILLKIHTAQWSYPTNVVLVTHKTTSRWDNKSEHLVIAISAACLGEFRSQGQTVLSDSYLHKIQPVLLYGGGKGSRL